MEKEKYPIDFDKVLEQIGGFGNFQLLTYALSCVCYFYSGLFIVSPIFGSKILQHRCQIPSCDSSTSIYNESHLHFTIPWNDEKQAWDECHRFPLRSVRHQSLSDSFIPELFHLSESESCKPESFDTSQVVPCDKWVYDTSEFEATTISEFDLTCDRSWMTSLEMSCIMTGLLIGSILLGAISDMFGRNIGFLISAFALSVAGLAGAASPNYYLFLVLRVIAGIGSLGCFQVAFITAIEYIGPKWRTICGVLLNVPFALGEAVFGLLAYFIRDWRYLHVASIVPVTFIFTYYWIMPESARWLLTQNRTEDALIILKKAAKLNGRTLSEEVENQLLNKKFLHEPKNKSSILDLMRSPTIRNRSFILFFAWMVCSLLYYGLSSYVGSFSGNMFVNFSLVVIIEIPGFLLSAFTSNYFGRKLTLILSFIIGGMACIIAGFLPQDFNTIIVCLSLLGKFGITAAFSAIFVYTGEIFPTEYRAIGIGSCSFHSRIGGIIAPFISNLSYTYKPLPSLIFGAMSCVAGFLVFFLPETLGETLPQTLEESENLGREQKTFLMLKNSSRRQREE